jgi:hypothetical protein
MRLADVDGEERDTVAELRRQTVERPNLGAEGRSGVRAEDERDRPVGIQLRETDAAAAVDERELEVRCGVADRDGRRAEVEIDRVCHHLLERLRLRHLPSS